MLLVGLEFKEGIGVVLVEVIEYQSCSKQLMSIIQTNNGVPFALEFMEHNRACKKIKNKKNIKMWTMVIKECKCARH